MKKLFVSALLAALLLAALPGGAWVADSRTGVEIAQSQQTNDTTTDTDPTTTLSAGNGTASTLVYAGQGILLGLDLTIDGNELDATAIEVNAASASTPNCTTRGCAEAAGATQPIGIIASAQEPSDREAQEEGFRLDNDDEDLEEFMAGRLGSARALTSADPTALGEVTGFNLDVQLTDDGIEELTDAVADAVVNNLIRLEQALEDLPQGSDSLDGLEQAVSQLRADVTSRPLVTLRGGDAEAVTGFDDGVLRTESTVDTSSVTVLPTDADDPETPGGLFIIEIGPVRSAAAVNGSVTPRTDSDLSAVSITILPGLLDVLDVDATTEASDVVRQLPAVLVDILPPALRDPENADDGVTLDRGRDALRLDLGTTGPETCLLDGQGLETCVDPGEADVNFDQNDRNDGVVVATSPVEVDAIPDGAGYLTNLDLHSTQAGASAAFRAASTSTSSNNSSSNNSSSNTSNSQTNLPQTGSSSTVVLPALALMLLSGLILLGLRRRTS